MKKIEGSSIQMYHEDDTLFVCKISSETIN